MTRLTIIVGLLLCGTTVGILIDVGTPRWSWAFMPMVIGIAMFICGVVATERHRRNRAYTVACLSATLGSIGCATATSRFDPQLLPAGANIQLLGFLACAICVLYLAAAAWKLAHSGNTSNRIDG